MAYSKSLEAKIKKAKSDGTKLAHQPKKRISTQQKIGSGHAKGPMANNVQNSVPFPVVVPFPMIPFGNGYPELFPSNGKPKKGKDKKKGPQDETEDEHDKDVDDEKDEDGDQNKEQKVIKNGDQKVGPGSIGQPRINKLSHDDIDNKEPNQNDKSSNFQSDFKKYSKVKKGSNQKEGKKSSRSRKFKEAVQGDHTSEDQPFEEEQEPEKQEKQEEQEQDQEHEQDEEEKDSKDQQHIEENDSDDEHRSIKMAEGFIKHKTKQSSNRKNSNAKTKQKERRVRRNAFRPIIGNPEDIMPYLMFDSEVETAPDGTNEHVIKTRDTGEEPEETLAREFESDTYFKQSIGNEADLPHVINVREIEEEDEEEEEEEEMSRDMRTRSLPDGRSHEHVKYEMSVENALKKEFYAQ